MTAGATNVATATVDLRGISVAGGSGLTSLAALTDSADTTASATSAAGLTASGAVAVSASSATTVRSSVSSNGGGVVNVAVLTSDAPIDAATTASFDGSILRSTGVSVKAAATNSATGALATSGISLVGITVSHTYAGVNTIATTTARYGTGALVTTGAVAVGATATNTVTVTTDALSAGIAGVSFQQPTARIDGATAAVFAGTQSGGTALAVTSAATNTATVTAGVIAAGLVGVGDASPEAVIGANAKTTATVAAGARVAAPSAAVSVSAVAANVARSSAGATTGGAVAVGTSKPQATVASTTGAYLWGSIYGATVRDAGAASVSVRAHADDTADAALSSSGGGAVKVDTAAASGTVTSLVETQVGNASTPVRVVAVGSITLAAESNPLGLSSLKTSGGGVVNVGSNSATVSVTPRLSLSIAANSAVTAGGDISISSQFNSTATPPATGGLVIGGIDPSSDTITVASSHGLTTGMTVSYTVSGGSAAGGLAGGATYGVIALDATRLLLGSEFIAAQVDPVLNTIRFGTLVDVVDDEGKTTSNLVAANHNLRDGSVVLYRANGATVPGLVDGRSYRVGVVDASTVQLFELNTPTGAVKVGGTGIVGGAIVVGNAFVNGQTVVYLPPTAAGEFSSGTVDIVVENGVPKPVVGAKPGEKPFVEADNNEIYLAAHGFATGTALVYGSNGAAIGGLANGQTYYVIALDANRFQLAATYCQAMGKTTGLDCLDTTLSTDDAPVYIAQAPLLLAADHSEAGSEVLHKLYLPANKPIGGLVDGGTYYVVNATSASFQLSSTPGGTAIAIDGTGVTGDHTFASGAVDLLGGSTSAGNGRLIVDLQSAGSGTQTLVPTSISGSAPAGGQVSTATVRSSGGGFVSTQVAHTSTNVVMTQDVSVGAAAAITSGGSFSLTTRANVLARADSTNGGAGFVAVGAAESSSTAKATTTVDFGAASSVTSGWNLTVDSTTNGSVNAYATGSAEGLGAGVTASATGTLTLGTRVTIAGSLIADHLLDVKALSTPNGDVSSSANAQGLGADSTGNATLTVTADAGVDVTGTGSGPAASTVLQGDEVSIVASMGHGSLTAYAYGRAKALGADADTNVTVAVTNTTAVTLHDGVNIVAWENLRLAAENTALAMNAHSESSCGCFGGDTDSNATVDYQGNANVTAARGALLQTAHLAVATTQSNPGIVRNRDKRGGTFDSGSRGGYENNSGNRPIVWNADVVLHAGDPQLLIDRDGTILKAYNVAVTSGGVTRNVGDVIPAGQSVVVAAIANIGGATASFTVSAGGPGGVGTLTGTAGSFRLQNTFDFVRIRNLSNRPIELNGISVVNLDSLAATVDIKAYNRADVFRYTILAPVFTPSLVEIINYRVDGSANDLTLRGSIVNPIGHTVVDNRNGDILYAGTGTAIVSNTVFLSARNGSVGSLAAGRAPVSVLLVESAFGSAATIRSIDIQGDAENDFVVDLAVVRRSGAAAVPVWTIGAITAGRSIDLVIGDTLVGRQAAGFQGHAIQNNVYTGPGDGYVGLMTPPTGLYSVYFYPDKNAQEAAFAFGDPVLAAFGTDTAAVNSSYVFTSLTAGSVIAVRHTSTATAIDVTASTDVDATVVDPYDAAVRWSTSDGLGRIDMTSNGPVVVTEARGDLLVGTIRSTTGDVTLTAADTAASILDGSGLADGTARVVGTVVTLTARGTVGTASTPLAIHSSNAGRGRLVAAAPAGVYLTQVGGDLVLGRVAASAGSVSLSTTAGSILNDSDTGAVRVVATDIDLVAVGGRIGTAAGTADIVVDTAAAGRLVAQGTDGVFVTEASGSLALLLAASSAGDVRITVPFVAGGVDEDLTLLASGTTVDGRTIATGGATARGSVELRTGNDLRAPLGTLVSGATVTLRTAFGQGASPVGTTTYLGGALAGSVIRVFGGNGADTVTLFETVLDGDTFVYGGATPTAAGNDGSDLVSVTRITILPGTHVGTAADAYLGLPIRNALHIDGQNGDNQVEITVWGADDTSAHDTRIEVIGSGTDPLAINSLTVTASAGDDVVLLRSVAFVPNAPGARRPAIVAVGTGVSTLERITYDRSVNGRLTIDGLGGDDTFALDDTTAALTIDGGAGDDTFIVGQFFPTQRVAPYVAALDAFATVTTNRGELSPGISRPAVLYGGAGDDTFVVSSNRAELRIEGGAGENTFLFVTSTVATSTPGRAPIDPATGAPAVDPATGAPVVAAPVVVVSPYKNGFVSVDAGESGTLTVVGDAAQLAYDPTRHTLTGAGLQFEMYGFDEKPDVVAAVTLADPVGLPTESGTRFRRLAATPPYVFADRDADAAIIVRETDGSTHVDPVVQPDDSYTIRLATASTSTVYIVISAAFGGGTPFVLFSVDGGRTWLARVVLAIGAGDVAEHEVLVKWAGTVASLDDLPANSRVVTTSHSVSSDDPAFDFADVRNVYVNLVELPAVVPDPPVTPVTPATPADPTADPAAPPVAAPAAPSRELAYTGVEALPLAFGALLLLLLGAALLLAGRRRRSAEV